MRFYHRWILPSSFSLSQDLVKLTALFAGQIVRPHKGHFSMQSGDEVENWSLSVINLGFTAHFIKAMQISCRLYVHSNAIRLEDKTSPTVIEF